MKMKNTIKNLLVIAFTLAPTLSFADDALTAELLEQLIKNSATIQLEGADQDQTLSGILAGAFAVDTMVQTGQDTRLNSVSSQCEPESGNEWTCSVYIIDGDYVKTIQGYKKGEGESAWILTFKTIRKGKHQLKDGKVHLDLAG
jgi:hypothetical protein